jgi:hypothetical protein
MRRTSRILAVADVTAEGVQDRVVEVLGIARMCEATSANVDTTRRGCTVNVSMWAVRHAGGR